jgi:hypothetical protein
MSRAAVTVFVICGAGAVLAAAYWLSPGSPAGPPVVLPVAAGQTGASRALETSVGAAGCLAAACHGAPAGETLSGRGTEDGWWRSSGTHWVAADPHRGAYSLLTDAPARPVKVTAAQIMGHLYPDQKGKVDATADARCLACHTTPALAHPGVEKRDDRERLAALREDGVGCEACHGPAGKWIVPHTTWADDADRRTLYREYGMTPLFDVGERAATCVGCHVGAPADEARGVPVRDMNHDMIAAGHPALTNFDFAEYHRRLPRHWFERDRVKGLNPVGPGSEARRWLVGRVAHAEAACRLLADRAERAKAEEARTPWPEFAEFDCAGCHHGFQGGVNRPGGPGSPNRGKLAWQPIWPVTGGFDMQAFKEVGPLLAVMKQPKPPGWGKVGGPAKDAAEALAKAGRELPPAPDVARYFPTTVGKWPDWDPSGQLLFGLAAVERDREKPRDFDPAFGAVRGRDWPAAADKLDPLLKR